MDSICNLVAILGVNSWAISGKTRHIYVDLLMATQHPILTKEQLNMPTTRIPATQAPIHSGFEPTTIAREVLGGIDLTGKVAIVTGGYSGIGLETTRALAEAGATVIVPARTPDKARHALSNISRVEQGKLDLLDPASIDGFASKFLASGRPLHILINNAGIMATPLTRDARGYESQFSANHLGHFQLTARLWPALLNAHDARVVSLSSRGHQRRN
jgi:hypothetical protein